MKKITFAFLISILTLPAIADNWIKFKAQAVEDAINTLVAQENRVATKNEYEKQMDQTTGKISVMGIYKVCAAAGKDIRTNNGYSECRYFINYIAEKSNFGTKSATQANCANQFNGVWSLSADGKTYQCVGKDGYKLVYKKSCESEDANSKCIKDFAGLKTQGPIGREFIVEYGNKKNLKLTCYTGFETRRGLTSPLGQDYIRCSAGGKSYEFEFDSLNQDPGKTSIESENKAMCEFFGGKIVKHPDSSVEKFWQSCDISQELCKGKLHSLALRIGHTTMYQGYCRFSREAKSTDYANLHTIKGVDSKIFYNTGAQMRSDMAKVQLEEYLHNTFPNESYIVCDPTAKKFNYGLGIDPDYVMTCTVGHQQVDFLFHDLTEGRKSRADTGMDAMQCIISGGTFKGESCRGPTPDECTKLDAALRARGSKEGAKWDKDVRACILGNAMKSYKEDVVTNYVVGAVVIVGGTLVVIGTGGVATPVVVGGVEMLVGDLAINYAIDANHRRLSKQAANRFGSFLDDADKCTTEQCALKALEKHYATLSGVWNDLNTDDQNTVNSTIDRLIGLIKTEYVACGKNDKGQTVYATAAQCAMQSSTLRAIDYIDKVSEPVLIIGSIIYKPGFVTTRFVKMKNISKVAKTMNVSYKEAKQLVKAGDALHDATAVATKADDAADATRGTKIANADSPESEAGFAAMMNRVDESNARNITPEDIEADFVRRQAAEGGKYTEADIAERVQHYNDYRDERVLLDANGQPVVNKKGETQYMDTQRMYTQDGVYTEERQKIHEAILDDLFKDADKAQPAAGEKPTFVMLGGRGGSGKSSLDGIAYDRSRSIVIDADDIKTKLPEYKNLVDSHSEYAGLNAWEVHEESSDIVKEALDMARERGINVVLDGTMSSSKSALSKITPFEDAGYRIEGAYMYLPREESTVRAMGRGMGEGRFVPTDVLLNMKDNEKAFGEVSGHFDSWSIWTTEGLQKGEVPNMIGHSEGLSVFEKPVNPDLSAPLTGIIKE